MLTRSNQLASPQEYLSDSLLTLPSISDSIYHNLSAGFATPNIAARMTNDEFSKSPDGKSILNSLNAVNLENETPGMGWPQFLLAQGSNMLGQALNPATWALGEAGGLATRGITSGLARIAPDAASIFMRTPLKDLLAKPISDYVPEMIGKEGEQKALSLGLMSEKTLKNFGVFAGASVPQAIVDNFDLDTNHISWGGVAREAGEMGAFGMAIGSVPFAWGVLRGKINRGLGVDANNPIDSRLLDEAREKGHITPQEHQWYSDYLEYQKDPGNKELAQKLQSDGSVIINKNGHTANTVSNEAMFNILDPDDVSNLHGVIADQLASAHLPEEQRMALSNFVVHNRLDEMRENPKDLDGIRGYVDFINQKLESKPSQIAKADKILDENLLKSVKENMPMSQKEMLSAIKKTGFDSNHIQRLPLSIPEAVVKHLKQLENIKSLEGKNKKYFKEYKKTGSNHFIERMKANEARIQEIKGNFEKPLTPKEELLQLKEDLLSKGLKPGFERSAAYHRLMDLSSVWHNASTLLDRVHLEHEYNRQEAFKEVSNHVLKIADSDMPKLANPENVMDYLKSRIERSIEKLKPVSELSAEASESQKVPTDADSIIAEQEERLKNSKAEDSKKELDEVSEKYKEFKGKENVFKNLISCVLGGLGG